jgi:hypothetical protein
MEELLPIIIGIIWLAYTWYSKSQKKKQGKDSQPTSESREPSILEQLFVGETIPYSEPEPAYEEFEEMETITAPEMKTEKERIRPFLTSELSGFTEEGQSGLEVTLDEGLSNVLHNETELVFDTLGDVEDFDLRKAVVLSEILNAPYIDYK